jgi:glycosyltransferase involved in cell wall biosynthesis
MTPTVSIVILNFNHPEIVDVCLRTLTMTEGVDYEVVVVDNGSEAHVVDELQRHHEEGRITTLVLEPENHLFSVGNNVGVRAGNLDSEFVLLLNSDVAFLRPDWLAKLVAWADGTIEHRPSVWGLKPTKPEPGPRDIVSAGFAWDPAVVPSLCRPEGFCCLIRRSVWRDMSPDFPWLYGFEEMIASVVREGATCGVLSQYPPYLVHREGASGASKLEIHQARTPDIPGWFRGLKIETLDFSFGLDEHDSYLSW